MAHLHQVAILTDGLYPAMSGWSLSSLAFAREWRPLPKLFSVSEFVVLAAVAASSGSAATVTGASTTVARCVGSRPVGNRDAAPTVGTSKAPKDETIIAIASGTIENAAHS